MNIKKLAFAGLFALNLGGCAIVSIERPNGDRMTYRVIGPVVINPDREGAGQLSALRGIGLFATPAGYSMGLIAERTMSLADDCRVIFWIDNAVTASAIQEQVGNLNEICIFPHN